MKRAVALVIVVAAASAIAGALREHDGSSARAAPAGKVLRAQVGDVIQVGATIVCKAERRHGLATLTCTRSGRLRGTYGARMSARRLTAFRFTKPAVAETVFSAKHNGGFTTCGRCR